MNQITTLQLKEGPYNIFAVGDIHGKIDKLDVLLGEIQVCWDTLSPEEQENSVVIFVGDYIDRGAHSKEVVERIRNLVLPKVCLQGNHEEMAYDSLQSGPKDTIFPGNWGNGCNQTLKSYGVNYMNPVTQEYQADLAWMKSLPIALRIDRWLFVHAGINPRVLTLENQTASDMLWIRDAFLRYDGPWPEGITVIHGHTPTPMDNRKVGKVSGNDWEVHVFDNRINIDTGSCFSGPQSAVWLTKKGLKKIISVCDEPNIRRG